LSQRYRYARRWIEGNGRDVWVTAVAARGVLDLLLHARARAGAVAGTVCRCAWQRAGHIAGLAMEPFAISRQSPRRYVRRSLVVLRFSETSIRRQQSRANQLDRDHRLYMEVLRDYGAGLYF